MFQHPKTCLINCFIQKTDLEIASFNNFAVSFKHVLMSAGMDLNNAMKAGIDPT